ncbi:Uncharacterized mitochondrial protein AtMg00310 [Linum perenne]
MNKLLRNFFWSGSTDKRTFHWCNFDTLCTPKAAGGLGFRDFRTFNSALVAKQAWRILESPEALWVRLLKSLYFPNTDFQKSVKGSRASWIWAGICGARHLLDMGALKVLGDGTNISIHLDSWIPDLPTMNLPINTGPFSTVSEWINPSTRSWDIPTISIYCNENQKTAIQRTPIGPAGLKDDWRWKFTKDGRFTVRSAYHTF